LSTYNIAEVDFVTDIAITSETNTPHTLDLQFKFPPQFDITCFLHKWNYARK